MEQLAILTHSPSPYQVELFNSVSQLLGGRLTAIYLYDRDPSRQWSPLPVLHQTVFISNAADAASQVLRDADLAIMNYYADPFPRRVFASRTEMKRPWVFWGERPGYRLPLSIGRLVRHWTLRDLHSGRAPIWGIGGLAVRQYRREFGEERRYHNIPYFSDLKRFHTVSREAANSRTVLYSGALIPRKGIDLLARAFARIAREHPNLRLKVLGHGELEPEIRRTLNQAAPQVEFLGFRDWPDLPEIYAKADVLCVPSRYDGWGLVVPEGLAAGLPVIATDQTGAAIDLVQEGVNGWLIPAGSQSALEEALRRVALLPVAQLSEMSVAAQASVQDHSLANGAKRFISAAREAVEMGFA